MTRLAPILAAILLTGVNDAHSLQLVCPDSITVACRLIGQTEETGRPQANTDCGTVTMEYRDSLVATEAMLLRTWTATDTCGGIESCEQVIRYFPGLSRIAVLPLENLAAAEDGVRVLARLLEESISRATNLEIIAAGRVEDALLRGRIRQPYLMDDEQRARLTLALDAEYYIVGSLLNYSTYNDQYSGPIPMVGCTLQLQSATDGATIWSESIHAVGSDGEWLFGMGVEHDITRLAADVAKRSVEKFAESIRLEPCPPTGR